MAAKLFDLISPPRAVSPITESQESTPEESDSEFEDFMLDAPPRSRFTSGNFLKASQIIRSIKNPTNEDRRPVFWSDEERIITYELVVSILKLAPFLKDALDKSNFYARFPHLEEVGQEEILVILYDLFERDFQVSQDDCPLPEAFSKLQIAILSSKTKLIAHIAKLRIKHEATSLENLLSSNPRHRHSIDKNPLYIWINLGKVSVEKMIKLLKAQGLSETAFEDDTLIQENLFSVSHLHPDLIRLHSDRASQVANMKLFRDGLIVTQDRSACIPVYILVKALYFKEALNHRGAGMEHLNPFPNGIPHTTLPQTEIQETDEWYQNILEGQGKNFSKPDCVVVTHCGSGRTAAHLAVLLAEGVPRYLSRSKDMTTSGTDLAKAIKGKFLYRPPFNVVVFGTPQDKVKEITKYLKKTLGLANIRLYADDFITVHPKDSRIKGCGAVLVNPPSSGSALKDPAAYICSEGGDEQVLSQFSQFMSSSTAYDELGNSVPYSPNQAKYLSHALNVPNVKLVLYTTCSNLACENSEVVRHCLGKAQRSEETRKCQLYASIVLQSQSKLYKEVNFEVVNLDQLMDGYDAEACLHGDFVDMQPSSACSGVFAALIRRRDRQATMAKTAVKQFVSSQIKQWSEDSTDGELEELLSKQTSVTSSSGTIRSGLTATDLSQYLIRKLNLQTLENSQSQEELKNYSKSSTTIPLFPAQMKKKLSKKAIVNRVSIPTYSSTQRQKEKYFVRSFPSTANSNWSGVQTPRSPVSSVSGRKSENDPRSRAQSAVQNKTSNRIELACPHGHVCVCARHAKRFPGMINSL